MKTLSLFQDVAQALQRDASSNRLKKLILFTCTNVWPTDSQQIEEADIESLLEQLYHQNPTLEDLQSRLAQVIQRISKRTEYSLVAQTLLSQVERLYELEAPDVPVPAVQPPKPKERPSAAWAQLEKLDFDPYKIRLDLMAQTNPLRAKIVLYTALYSRPDLTEQGLSLLKRHSLDELLRELWDKAATPEEIEGKLRAAAKTLDGMDQASQAAGALIQTLKPLFVYSQPEVAYTPPMSGGLAEVVMGSHEQHDWIESAPLPEEDHFYAPYEDPFAFLEPQTPVPATYLQDEEDLPQKPESMAPVPSPAFVSSQAVAVAEPPAVAASPVAQAPGVHPFGLPVALKSTIDQNMADLMVTIENTLSNLGNQLDERLGEENPEEYMMLKYSVMRGFLQDVEDASASFVPFLRKLEESEYRLSQLTWSQPRITEDPIPSPHAIQEILAHSPLVQSRSGLGEEIQHLVNQELGLVKESIENVLSELSNDLDQGLSTLEARLRLTLKYQTLGDVLKNTERISSKFATLLKRMEEAERRLFNL
jgi:hypothetical protein